MAARIASIFFRILGQRRYGRYRLCSNCYETLGVSIQLQLISMGFAEKSPLTLVAVGATWPVKT